MDAHEAHGRADGAPPGRAEMLRWIEAEHTHGGVLTDEGRGFLDALQRMDALQRDGEDIRDRIAGLRAEVIRARVSLIDGAEEYARLRAGIHAHMLARRGDAA